MCRWEKVNAGGGKIVTGADFKATRWVTEKQCMKFSDPSRTLVTIKSIN